MVLEITIKPCKIRTIIKTKLLINCLIEVINRLKQARIDTFLLNSTTVH